MEGSHQPIITKEEFAQVRKILDSKSFSTNNRGRRGKYGSNDIWCNKLKCYCGSSMNRRVWRRVNNIPQYCYQCYSVRRHIVGGANRTLFSVDLPPRLCRTGT